MGIAASLVERGYDVTMIFDKADDNYKQIKEKGVKAIVEP